jgi:3-methyl-2-oxobutanoate hydroxymethyltransferase
MTEKKPPQYASWTHGKLPLPELGEMKRRGQKIVMVTAYDAPGGRLADAAGVDIILVGDSAAMVVLGHDSTVPATMDEMVVLTRAVTRGAARPLVVADMPFGSFQV